MTDYFPSFLYLSLGFWLFLLVFFIAFWIHLARLPDDKILDYEAEAMKNKKRLGIRTYRF